MEKGAALTSQDGDRLLYHPLPHETLVQRYRERTERVAADVTAALDAIAAREQDHPPVTVRGEEAMQTQAREIIAAAKHRVFVSGWPGPVAALAEALKDAEARGVKVYVLVYGELKLGVANLFAHPAPGTDRRIARPPEMFIVVGDHTEVIMGEVRDQAVGLWTRNRAVTLIAAEFIRHDIMLQEWSVRLGAMPADMQDLQAMWFFTREEGN
ncbi:MAG TPA: TrmB family transcriptional regulator sugar-binding domain-containing protein [Symbiobacteriaceae bacterium]|nr:TrmB family transcriptional regulator sugar-binding domain-containing protein [Symbiobacteriaceae bacterium]